jgi:hypothetical protein
MPFAPLLPRSYCTVDAKPRVPTAARMRVDAAPMFDSSRPVMSCAGRERVRRARARPVRPAVVREEEPLLRAGDDLVRVVRVDADLADRVVLRELARRLGVGRAEDVAPSTVQWLRVGRLEDALAAHREGAVVQVAGARVDRVVVFGSMRERVDRERGDEGVVVCDVHVVDAVQQFVVFQTPPPTSPAYATIEPCVVVVGSTTIAFTRPAVFP